MVFPPRAPGDPGGKDDWMLWFHAAVVWFVVLISAWQRLAVNENWGWSGVWGIWGTGKNQQKKMMMMMMISDD